MAVLRALFCLGLSLAVPLPAMSDRACGEFKIESPRVNNSVLSVHENTPLNITLTALNTNCSEMTYGDVVMSKNDTSSGIFMPHCKIFQSCEHRPAENNISCYCLGSSGFYSFSFVARRKDSGQWKWSIKSKSLKDIVVKFDVTYPPRITHLEIVGYDAYVRKHKSVTVVCSWENGNPPKNVRLLDRHKALLDMGYRSGNISHTFSPVVCDNAGVIYCEAEGSDRNMSTNMLIECPPEFAKTSNFPNVHIGKNDDVIFPFRTHTSNISSCHINQIIQKDNEVTNHSLTVLFNCTKDEGNASNFKPEIKHCLYFVTGKPPDLQLTLSLRNLKREDGGLWYVTISNDVGSDVKYIHVSITVGSDENASQGKEAYARLSRKRNQQPVLYRDLAASPVLHSQDQSEIYYDIRESQLDTDTHIPERKQSSNADDLPSLDYSHLVQEQSFNDIRLENRDYVRPMQEESGHNMSSEKTACSKHIKKDNSNRTSQNALGSLETIQTCTETSNVQQTSYYLKPVETGCQTSNVKHTSDYLKPVETGCQTSNVKHTSDYLKPVETGCQTSNVQHASDYLKPVETGCQTSNVQHTSDYLKPVETGCQTSIVQQTSDYLKPVQKNSQTTNVQQNADYLKLV